MAEEEQIHDGQQPEDEWEDRSKRMLRTISSLLIYVVLYTLIFRDLKSILLLVLVIIVHEAGHFAAMKAFGYKDIKLFFLPFFGALISGSHENISPFRRSLMVLAGPLPGIFIGLACLLLSEGDMHDMLFRSGLLFTLLNIFNLLPLKPLDGGNLLFIAFPAQARVVQTMFLVLLSLLLALFCIVRQNYIYLVAPVAGLAGAYLRWKRSKDQEQDDPPTQLQQLILMVVWLVGLVAPMFYILFRGF